MHAVIQSMSMLPRLVAILATLSACSPSKVSSPPTSETEAPSLPASGPTSKPRADLTSVINLPSAENGIALGENRTGINYVSKDRATCNGTQPCPCASPDLFHGKSALARMGINNQHVRAGTPCLLADYDGNGFTDAAFIEVTERKEKRVVVLMFDNVGLSAVFELPKTVQQLALRKGTGKTLLSPGDQTVFVFIEDKFRVGLSPTQ